jgi:uncharacterized protein YjbJ (UPF0337 family)
VPSYKSKRRSDQRKGSTKDMEGKLKDSSGKAD